MVFHVTVFKYRTRIPITHQVRAVRHLNRQSFETVKYNNKYGLWRFSVLGLSHHKNRGGEGEGE